VLLLLFEGGTTMRRYASIGFIVPMVLAGLAGVASAQRPAEGQLTVGLNFTIAPTYLDPSETVSVVTSTIVL